MGWSDNQPTEEGIYWFHELGKLRPEITHVDVLQGWPHKTLLVRFTNGRREQLRNLTGQWYGPLEVPS